MTHVNLYQIAETCQLAVGRLEWLQEKAKEETDLPENPYYSVDPAPPARVGNVDELKADLLNEDLSLFARYRAMFTLRNMGSTPAVLALAEGKWLSS